MSLRGLCPNPANGGSLAPVGGRFPGSTPGARANDSQRKDVKTWTPTLVAFSTLPAVAAAFAATAATTLAPVVRRGRAAPAPVVRTPFGAWSEPASPAPSPATSRASNSPPRPAFLALTVRGITLLQAQFAPMDMITSPETGDA